MFSDPNPSLISGKRRLRVSINLGSQVATAGSLDDDDVFMCFGAEISQKVAQVFPGNADVCTYLVNPGPNLMDSKMKPNQHKPTKCQPGRSRRLSKTAQITD